MATLTRSDGMLRLVMNRWERIGAMHGDLEIPVEHIESVVHLADPWDTLRGLRAPGTGLPYMVMLGTLRYDGVKDFAVIYGRKPTVMVTLRDHEYRRIFVTGADPHPLLGGA